MVARTGEQGLWVEKPGSETGPRWLKPPVNLRSVLPLEERLFGGLGSNKKVFPVLPD